MRKRVQSFVTAVVLTAGILPVTGVSAGSGYSSVTLEPELYSNVTTNYYEGKGGFASNGKFISLTDFMAMDIWKDEWKDVSEWEDDSQVNTLTFKGVDYQVKLTDSSKDNVKSGFASDISTTVSHTNIDIPDGNYAGVSFLGGADSSSGTTTGVIRFNYSDDTDSGWIAYEQPKVSVEDSNALAVKAKKSSFGNVTDADYIYLHQINVTADPEKTMESFDIIIRNSVLEENGTVTIKGTTGAAGFRYYSRYLAMSMLTDKAQTEKAKVKEIKSIIDTLPSSEDFSYTDENIEKLYNIRKILETVDETVLTDASDKEVLSIAKGYVALLSQVDIQKNNEKIKALGEKLKDLPEVSEITLSDEILLKLEEINKGLEDVDLSLEISAEYQQIIDNIKSYNEKIKELKVLKNDEVVKEIESIIKELPLIEEFEKYETYTEDVLKTLYFLKEKLALIGNEGVSEEYKESYEAAKEYAAKSEYYDTLKNRELVNEIKAITDTFPAVDSFEYTRENEELLGKISSLLEELTEEKLTAEQKKVCDTAREYVLLLKNFPPVSKILNPDLFANSGRAYFVNSASATYDSIGLNWEEVIKMDIWEEPWSFSGNTADNTFTVDGITYRMRVVSDSKEINSAYFGNSGSAVGYDTFDVDDGKYTGIAFFGGAAHAGSGYAGVRFDYDDGTSSPFITATISRLNVEDAGAIMMPAVNGTSGEKTHLYFNSYRFDNPNPEKTVVSISIPYRNVTIKDGVITAINPTSGGLAYNYWVRWFGMTLLQTSNEYKNIISDKFEALEKVKEDAQKTALSEVDEIVKSAVMMGMDITNIKGYDTYKAISDKYVRIFGYEKNVDLKNASVSVTFASDVDIEKSDVKLLIGEEEQDFDFSYKNCILKITFKNNFDYTSEYSLKLSKDISSKAEETSILGSEEVYSFTVPAVVAFTDFSVLEGDGEVDVTFTLSNNLMDKTDALVTICVLDESGKMTDSKMVRAKDIKKGKTMSASGISLKAEEGYTLKVFIIDNIENMNTIYKYKY